MKRQVFIIQVILMLLSCTHTSSHQTTEPGTSKSKAFPKIKPASTSRDTLYINVAAAVFYSPDSLQLEKIKSAMDSGAFAANMHEYDNLFRTSREIIKTHYPQLRIMEAKNVRYLSFITAKGKQECIDLDTIYDPCGVYIFDRKSKPLLTDMATIETNIRFYLAQ